MADKELKSLNFGGEDTYFPLPLVTSEDNDKILAVVDGDWSATTPEDMGYVNTSDATIEPLEVMNGEIAYGAEGQVIGTAPFCFVAHDNETLEYKVLKDGITLSNDTTTRKLISTDTELKFEDEFNISDLPNAEEVLW